MIHFHGLFLVVLDILYIGPRFLRIFLKIYSPDLFEHCTDMEVDETVEDAFIQEEWTNPELPGFQ